MLACGSSENDTLLFNFTSLSYSYSNFYLRWVHMVPSLSKELFHQIHGKCSLIILFAYVIYQLYVAHSSYFNVFFQRIDIIL
jgi:hypothetical protein